MRFRRVSFGVATAVLSVIALSSTAMGASTNSSKQSQTQSASVTASINKWGTPVGAMIGRGSNAPSGHLTAQVPGVITKNNVSGANAVSPNQLSGGYWWQNEPTSINVLEDESGEDGQVHNFTFSYYVQHVLPYEWEASWPMQTLEAGAVSIRTFAWYMINNPYNANIGADVDDTTNTEMFHPYWTTAVQPYASTIASAFTNTAGQIDVQWIPNTGNAYQMGGFYKAGTYSSARDSSSYNFNNNAYQNGEDYWANNGENNYSWMVTYYYPGTNIATSNGY